MLLYTFWNDKKFFLGAKQWKKTHKSWYGYGERSKSSTKMLIKIIKQDKYIQIKLSFDSHAQSTSERYFAKLNFFSWCILLISIAFGELKQTYKTQLFTTICVSVYWFLMLFHFWIQQFGSFFLQYIRFTVILVTFVYLFQLLLLIMCLLCIIEKKKKLHKQNKHKAKIYTKMFLYFLFPHIIFLFGFVFCQCCACVFAGAK